MRALSHFALCITSLDVSLTLFVARCLKDTACAECAGNAAHGGGGAVRGRGGQAARESTHSMELGFMAGSHTQDPVRRMCWRCCPWRRWRCARARWPRCGGWSGRMRVLPW